MSESKNKSKIAIFDGSGDYGLWKKRMIAYLTVQGLKDVLKPPKEVDVSEEDLKKPEVQIKIKEEQESREDRDEKALNLIFLAVGDKVLRKIENCTTSLSTIEALDKMFMPTTLPDRIYSQLEVYSFQMQEGKTIDQNVDDFLKLVGDLRHLQIEIEEETQAILLLKSLPDVYDHLAETLTYSKEKLSVEDVVTAAKSKEQKLKKQGVLHKTNGEGLFVRGRSETRSETKKVSFKDKSKSRSKSRDKKNGECWICGKKGHFKKQCYKWLERNKGNGNSSQQGESSLAQNEPNDLVGLVASEVNVSINNIDANEWILDTGCSFHMTPNKHLFLDLKETGGRVKMANESFCEVKGIGSIRFTNHDNTSFVLHDVRYMPDISRNLISVGTLEEKGCKFKAENGVLKIIKGCAVVMKGIRKQSLYILQATAKVSEANHVKQSSEKAQTEDTKSIKFWHSRMGHLGSKGMQILAKRGCFEGCKETELGFCEDCVIGKTHKISFDAAKHNTKEKLDYIHSDLWGSPNVPLSIGKCQYFISFTDDFTRKVWIYFLRYKDQAFKSFVEWKTMVEVQSNKKVKRLRTDNGLEFCNNEFDEFCRKEGIVRHRTCTYTPQQNGVAERLNRTLMNKVRSMLSESGLNKRFWAEAASTAVYLMNRSPSSAIEFRVPEELWTSSMPSLNNLRRFGCLVYVHTSQGKLEPRAKKGVFTGYPDGVKGFRVWIIEDDKCLISRNVIFREDVMYKDIKDQPQLGNESIDLLAKEFASFDVAGTGKSLAQGGVIRTEEAEAQEQTTQGQGAQSNQDEADAEDLEDYQLARDRSRRTTRPPAHLQDYECDTEDQEDQIAAYVCFLTEDAGFHEPLTFREAMEGEDSDFWLEASDEEMESLWKNHTWDLVDRPKDRKVIGCKWIFKRKAGITGVQKPRYKARLVAKGYSQKEGVDFNEIFAPVVKHVTIRYLLSMVTHFNMELHQMDVKTAFLHGNLEEYILMDQPEGYKDKDHPEKVCLLKRSLYGLKQSPRQWNLRFNDFMVNNGYKRSEYDYCVYLKKVAEGNIIYLLLYVDDILIASSDIKQINSLKELLSSEFEMKDLGEAKKILGMEITRDRKEGKLKVSQSSYMQKVLSNFKLDQSKPVSTPLGAHFKLRGATEAELEDQEDFMKSVPYQSAVGSLMYTMIGTRPDLAYPVGMVSRFMSKPIREHWQAVKWILRYLRGSTEVGLSYENKGEFVIKGYSDSDYAADLDNRKSITGMVFTAGGNVISWKSNLQSVVALSTTEAEYVALSEASKEAMWLKGLAEEFGFPQDSVELHSDSQSAIALAKNAVFHSRTKHIAVKYHHIRGLINQKLLEVKKIPTEYNPADIFTKVLPICKLQEALKLLRVAKN